MEEARALPLPTAEPAVERFLFGGRRVAPRSVATATAVVAAGASSVASVFSGGESFTASPPFPLLLMRFESTFCDVLRTNFIVGLRLFPELADDPPDAGFTATSPDDMPALVGDNGESA